MKTRSLICAAFLVIGLCAFAPATAQAQLGAWPSMASKRPTALFAGKDFDTVDEFFMRKDAAALRALVRRGLDPNETIDGTSLPLFCFPADWPEGIKILGEAGYDLDTICDLDGMKVPTIHAAVSLIGAEVIDRNAGLRCLWALIDAGADLESIAEIDADMGSPVKCTPLATALFFAASGEANTGTILRILDVLLEAGANPRATVAMGGLRIEMPMLVDAWIGNPNFDQTMVRQIRTRLTLALNGKHMAKGTPRSNACFAGEDADTVTLFFMRKDATALRNRLKGGLAPNETIDGVSLPLFCFFADWPEGIKILGEAGYDLNTICDLDGRIKAPTIHAAISMIGGGVIDKDAGIRCMRALIDAGANLEVLIEQDVGMGAPAKCTPVMMTLCMIASGMANPDVCADLCQVLLDKGANPNTRFMIGGFSFSALEYATSKDLANFMSPSTALRLQMMLKKAGAKE